MFAEEVGSCGISVNSGNVQWRIAIVILRIYIRTFSDKQFDDFLVPPSGRSMQRSQSSLSLSINILTISQVLFDGFDVSFIGSLVN